MVMYFVLAALTIIVLAIASYTDIKTREVPDWVSYAFIFSALGLRTLFSIENGWQVIVSGLIGFGIFFLLALLFYHTNQWGGADSKLLMGLGALLGVDLIFSTQSTHAWDLLSFFLLLLFVGAIYGLIWGSVMVVIKKNKFFPVFVKKLRKHRGLNVVAGICSVVFLILAIWSYWFAVLAIFPIMSYYLFVFVSSVEDSCFLKRVHVKKLTEGDWLAKDVYVNEEKVMSVKTLDRRDLQKLFSLAVDKKLRWVTIKEGMPFVPSFLLAYVILLFADKLVPWLFNVMF